MATLAVQQITQEGLVPTLVAASGGGDAFEPNAHTFLIVKNGSGSSINVTIVTTAEDFGQPIADIVVAVAAGTTAYIGPFEPDEVAQPGTGLCDVTYSAVTTVTVAALTISGQL